MGFKTPEDELDQFLATKPSWLRKILELDLALSNAEELAWSQSDWWQEGGKDEKEYIRLVRRIPSRWREYRRRRMQSAVADLPLGPTGRPRKDALADEARQLQLEGKSHADISRALNRKYGLGTTTREATRELLARKRRSTPDKS